MAVLGPSPFPDPKPQEIPMWLPPVAYLFVVAVVWLAAMLVGVTGYWFGVTFAAVFRWLTGGPS